MAVDLSSGEAAVAAPEGYPLRDASAEPGHGHGAPGRPDWVETGRELLELLVVRPDGASGANVTTSYTYDGRDRLRGEN